LTTLALVKVEQLFPLGMDVLLPHVTLEESRALIAKGSLYPGKPHWQIESVGTNNQALLKKIDARLEAENHERLARIAEEHHA
jgi:hypothetical protein